MVEGTDEHLLARRLCDLGVRIEGTPIEVRLERLYRELDRRGIQFRPHAWLSTDFFSPDGVPGIAVPFYLAHPRLIRLERKQVLHAEGSSEREFMQLLRHEAGHALDTAYQLHRRRDWRGMFGRRSHPYRKTFPVSPASRDYVRHLPYWYAQSHPAEDFAETFAVWLGTRAGVSVPETNARSLAKLELVDRLMAEVAGQKPRTRLREKTYALARSKETLAQYYDRKRKHTIADRALPFEDSLASIFAAGRPHTTRSSAAAWIREHRLSIAKRVRGPHRGDEYSIQQVLDDMMLSCRQQGLRLKPEGRFPTLTRIAGLVAQSLQTLQRGQARLCR